MVLEILFREGMKIESVARGGADISGEVVHKIRKHSVCKTKSLRNLQQHVEPNSPGFLAIVVVTRSMDQL